MNDLEKSISQAVGKKSGPSENVFISPFSVAAVLSMAHVGAKGNTASQLKSSLNLNSISDEKIHGVLGNLVRNTKVCGHLETFRFNISLWMLR